MSLFKELALPTSTRTASASTQAKVWRLVESHSTSVKKQIRSNSLKNANEFKWLQQTGIPTPRTIYKQHINNMLTIQENDMSKFKPEKMLEANKCSIIARIIGNGDKGGTRQDTTGTSTLLPFPCILLTEQK